MELLRIAKSDSNCNAGRRCTGLIVRVAMGFVAIKRHLRRHFLYPGK
ncbi:hypothetical protein DSBG_4478 [Desulfosporosinus sp. BG]|nr:hypothetical protein DSBG_4478 [Desulfosporosinus sp. BG]